ncbi:hypothetical protein ACET3Z_005487 [Daucus carota]
MNPPENPNNENTLKTTLSSLKTLIHLSQSITTLLSPPTTTIPPQPPSSPSPVPSSSFFYQNCPSVVSLPPPTPHPFSLPPFLTLKPPHALSHTSHHRFLPSDYMFLLKETNGWNDYPLHYSCIIRRLLLCLASTGTKLLVDVVSRWVLANAPSYGLVIDVSVKDHVVLLLRSCLRPILTEAVALSDGDVNQFYFSCPVLCQVMGWYGTQVGILFGEMNGKLFTLGLFKHLVLNVTMNLLMFGEKPIESGKDDFVCDGEISVSQVEDAVAAFRERSLLEQKLKAARTLRQLNRSQRAAEHEYISKRAVEERHKRPDYKPIIEHDMFSWQRGHNKDTSITKSREELLAEERDYKRRRMSYRGKKIKRTTTQVMRDIIEEYTEEIKAAGGFGHLQHVAEESGKTASDSLPVSHTSADNVSEKGSATTYNRTHSHSYKEIKSTMIVDQYPKDFNQFRRDQKTDTNKYDRSHNSKSPEKLRNKGCTGTVEQNSVRGQHDGKEGHKKSSRRSSESNYSSSHEHSRHRKERFKGNGDKSRPERSVGRSHRSDSVAHKKFKDRYDPSESWNTDEDNL